MQAINTAVETAHTDGEGTVDLELPEQSVSTSDLEEDDTVENVLEAG